MNLFYLYWCLNIYFLNLENKSLLLNQIKEMRNFFLSSFFSLSANVNVMDIWWLFFIRSDRNWWCNCWLCNLLNFYCPLIFWFLQIAESILRLPIWNTNINSCLCQNTVNFWNYLTCISGWILAALKLIKFLPKQNLRLPYLKWHRILLHGNS